MATKTWARLDAALSPTHATATVLEIVTLDAALVPGKNIFAGALVFVDVTSLAGIVIGSTTTDEKAFAAPIVAGPSPEALSAYANAKQVILRDSGININIGTASTPDEVNVASDVNGRSLVSGCVQLIGLANQNSQPAPTFPWINNSGTQLSLTASQMLTIGYQLGSFVQATYGTLGAILAAIAAGTITTLAQIDTPPAGVGAWPATSY